jgi:hypothetical protein
MSRMMRVISVVMICVFLSITPHSRESHLPAALHDATMIVQPIYLPYSTIRYRAEETGHGADQDIQHPDLPAQFQCQA